MNVYVDKIDSLLLEISSNCNVSCLGCMRNDLLNHNNTTPGIPKNNFLQIDLIKDIIESKMCENISYVDFCGTIDEPTTHPNFLEIIEYITSKGIQVIIQTNGSLRTPDFWKNLANIMKINSRSNVKFSIDGLEDTNHLYRRGSNFKKIIDNAKAYINAGGNAEWQFLIFDWNKHQVDEARNLANELKFNSFKTRPDRADVTIDENELKQRSENFKKNLSKSWNDKINNYNIMAEEKKLTCFAKEERQFFISYDGKVWPCCFLANARYQYYDNWKEYTDRFNLYYEKNWNSLYYHSFESIISNSFYQNDLVQSFESTYHGSGKFDRIIRCTQTCCEKGVTQ